MIIQSKGDVIILRGVLAENHWPALKSVVSLLLKRHPAGVIIDGRELTEVSDAGAQTFLDASEFIGSQRARVMVAGLADAIVREISDVPGIRSQLPRAATVEEARASLAISGAESLPSAPRRPVVLVPLIGDWHRSLEYAMTEASKLKADIHLLYVLAVPRAQPLGVPLPENEREAERILADAEAPLKAMGYNVRKLSTRARLPIEGVARFAAESNPRILVVAYPKSEFEAASRQQDIFGTFSREAPCEVAVICSVESPSEPAPSSGQPRGTVLLPLVGAWTNAVEFVGTQASEKKMEVDLLFVVQVPRAMSLDASVPVEEQKAAAAFAEAENALKRHRLSVRRVLLRSRDATEGIVRHAAATMPKMLVTSSERPQLDQDFTRNATIGALCRDVPVDVVTVCPPRK
jgi:nucleotide-binding universal stress UspA family protein